MQITSIELAKLVFSASLSICGLILVLIGFLTENHQNTKDTGGSKTALSTLHFSFFTLILSASCFISSLLFLMNGKTGFFDFSLNLIFIIILAIIIEAGIIIHNR